VALIPNGIHHVAYCTRDPEATYEFYTKKLGMPLARTENHKQGEGFFRHFFFDMGNGECLAFFYVEGVGEQEDYKTDISETAGLPVWVNHIAFQLHSLEELETKKSEIKAAGLDQMMEVDHGWCTSVYLVDPNGIMVEYCVTTDAAEFQQTEEEALALMRQPFSEIGEETRKEPEEVSKRV